MAEAVKRTHRGLLKMISRLSASLLGALGVITTGCEQIVMAYGMPPCSDHSLIVHGRVMCALDSTGIDDIHLGLSLPDQEDFQHGMTDNNGEYIVGYDYSMLEPWEIPDTMLLRAVDPQGEWPDTYPDLDTLIWAPYIGTTTTLTIDLYMEPYGED
ncbi:MAG TPA: hypothetical protein PLM22_09500 [Candidatus Sabulitectum sp.]|nr:hypothetical protein [Candidatus Sabulitectum sp.]HPF32028.1 hypothetical protein [Candidatus Sabulitectum sp.]HPJ29156.1 hypothetical protein [Candidatus Sabulitectum sp.]HPR21578.1 hypothetical protein [Candidatus Sabulitectum sp.]